MMNRFSNMMCWLVLVILIALFGIIAGCEQGYRKRGLDEATPADRAMEATGGHQAWTKAKELQVDCIVTFYKPDGSFYLTKQHHEIRPWSNSIRISGTEPQGKFAWQLSKGRFRVSEGAGRVDALPVNIGEGDFAKAILDIATAPVRLSEGKTAFAEEPELVKIEGLWYYPIERAAGNVKPRQSKSVFYQNMGTSLVDRLWLVRANGAKYLAVRGYDYGEVENNGVWLPAQIEIFRTDYTGALQQRLVKIDYRLNG